MVGLWLALILTALACVNFKVVPVRVGNDTIVNSVASASCYGRLEVLGKVEGDVYSVLGNITVERGEVRASVKLSPGETTSWRLYVHDLKRLYLTVLLNGEGLLSYSYGNCIGLDASYEPLYPTLLGYGVTRVSES